MHITETPIWDEIQHIRLTGAKSVHFNYTCEITLGDGDDKIVPLSLLQIDVDRNYHNRFSDVTKIRLLLGKGTYDHKLYPYKENFTVTIRKYPISEVEEIETDDPHEVRVYKGVLVEDTSGAIEGDTSSDDPDEIDKHVQNEYEIQLIDRAVEQLRFIGVSGIYLDVTTGDCLRGLLTIACSKIQGLSIEEEMLGVDLVEPDNKEVRKHCVIPHGLTAVALTDYMQEQEGGVYSTGIGTYIQNKLWYIYPEFHLKRFTEEKKTLTVLNVADNELPGIERTYFTDGNKVIVISTGETIHTDESEAMQMNYGNGLRFAIGDALTPKSEGRYNYEIPFREIIPEGGTFTPRVSRSNNTDEYIFKPREDELNLAPVSPRRITDNPYHEASQVCRRFGGHVFATWEHADPDLLYPGMPVRYLYMEDGELIELSGVLMGNTHMIAKKGASVNTPRYVSISQIHIFVESLN